MEDPRIISPQFNSPKMPYYNVLVNRQQNRGFIHKIVNQYKVFAEEEDLEQEGYLGLSEAVWHYDPDEGVTFLHYASYWIKQSIVRYIKSNGTVRLPEHVQERIRKYNRIVQKWQQDHHRSPPRRGNLLFLRG